MAELSLNILDALVSNDAGDVLTTDCVAFVAGAINDVAFVDVDDSIDSDNCVVADVESFFVCCVEIVDVAVDVVVDIVVEFVCGGHVVCVVDVVVVVVFVVVVDVGIVIVVGVGVVIIDDVLFVDGKR